MNLRGHFSGCRLPVGVALVMLLIVGAFLAFPVRPSHAAAVNPNGTGIVVPLYSYPTDSTWDALILVHNAHPNVPLMVIVDPTSSGAGSSIDPNFVTGINSMHAAGITVIGYIDTVYASRGLSSVEADVTNWWNWYHVDGVFLDEFANFAGSEVYYRAIDALARTLGMTFTMGNAGSIVPSNYYGILDSLLIAEDPSYPITLPSDTAGYAKSGFGYLAYGVPLNTAFELDSTRYVGWLYITSDGGSNPWDTLPAYLSAEFAVLEPITSTTSTTSTSTTTSNSTTTSTTTSTSTSLTTTTTSSTTTNSTVSGSVTIKVRSFNVATNTAFTGMWVEVYDGNDNLLASGYTAFSFTGIAGKTYMVCTDGYLTTTFAHWGNGSTQPCRTITPQTSVNMVAWFN